MEDLDHKVKPVDVIFPLGGYATYRLRNRTTLHLDHPSATRRSKCLFAYHLAYGTLAVIGSYKLAESVLEMITSSF